MIGTSINQVPFVQNDGLKMTISFNENIITEADGQKTYEYETAVLDVTNDFATVRDAIIAQCDVTSKKAREIARQALGVEPTLDEAKEEKLEDITDYDKSSAVNEFTLAGNPMWLPLEERKSMRQSLIALKAEGIETFTYWLGLTPITMPVAQFEAMLNAVEIYALQCFNVTAQHKANIMALTTLAEVSAYDFTVGYPEKLEF